MTATTASKDIEELSGDPKPLVLPASNLAVNVQRLKTRQTFKLLKIFTSGAGPIIANLNFDTDEENFVQELLAILLISLPEAEDEAMEFITSMVEPADLLDDGGGKNKVNYDKNVETWQSFYKTFQNPELDDTVEILTAIIQTEGPHLAALGKKIAAMLPTAAKAQQTTSSKKRSTK